MRALAKQAAGAYGLTRGQLASIDAAMSELDGGELSDYAMELFDAAVNAAARRGATGLTLDDITSDLAPDLHRQIADEVDAQVAAELRARELERRPRRSAPPATPQGRAPGGDTITVENLATSGAAGTVLTSDGAGGLTMEVPDVGVGIKSRQAGTISISSGTTTGTATITADTIANCQVNFQGTSGLFAVDVAGASTPINPTDVPMTGRVALTATTTVTATRGAPYTYGGGATTTVTGYEVLEWQ